MMKFTNPEDFVGTSDRLGLSGWYAQDSSGDYLGVVRKTDDTWYVGFTPADEIGFPITIDRIPR